MTSVITRFPPSPTGLFHVGSARTALFNYLFTKHHGGKMVFRFEDTDKERSKREYEEDILAGLAWLGIVYEDTEKILRQSERTEIYKKHVADMIASGKAYEAEESRDGSGNVIRFKNPNTTVVFQDLVRGEVTVDTTDLGDFVIARNINDPLYHLTVVVDDHEMGVTHVIRGEDGISNTPRQILIQEALGAQRPVYAHIPFILAPDRSKLSKRYGSVSLTEYKEKGYLPEAFVNYLALLGWNPGTDQELFSMEELITAFDITQVQKGGAIFDIEKLNWFNKAYIKKLPDDIFKIHIVEHVPEKWQKNTEMFEKVLPLIKERITYFSEVAQMIQEGEWAYFFATPDYEIDALVWKDATKEETQKHLEHVYDQLSQHNDYTQESIKTLLWDYATEEGRGAVLWPLRYALSGQDKSPDPFVLAEILGKDETLKRIKTAIEKLQ